jgi:hypothetical protein
VVHAVNPDSLRLNEQAFDLRLGSPGLRQAIMRGEAPLPLMAGERAAAEAFARRARRYWLYQ